ncbi:MAG: hypothetical protein GY842_00665 [bacterium]|nr:hypothetical protein [bacterium]
MWGDCKDKSRPPVATPTGPDLDANGEVAHRTRRRGVFLLAAPPVMLRTLIDASGEVAQLAVRFLEELDDPLQQTGEERCPTIQGHV